MSKERIVRRKNHPAFTLIELLVVLIIMSLLLVVTVPKIGAIYDRQLVEQQAEIIEKEMIWLHSEAQHTGKSTFFKCVDAQSYALTVEQPMGVQSDTRTVVNKRIHLRMNTTSQQIVFHPTGGVFDKGTLTIQCGKEVRTISVNNFGRIRVGRGNG